MWSTCLTTPVKTKSAIARYTKFEYLQADLLLFKCTEGGVELNYKKISTL